MFKLYSPTDNVAPVQRVYRLFIAVWKVKGEYKN
jgi:hypothetical protein